jgi:transposase-like protein
MESTKVRVRHYVAEKPRIGELTFQPRQSVARVALAEGVNSHQVFQWRRAYRAGELVEAREQASPLLLVIVSAAGSSDLVERRQIVSQEASVPSGAIHIEFPGRAISVEHGADRAALQTILESLRERSSFVQTHTSGSPQA